MSGFPYLVTFDLTDNQPATIRARLADDDIDVHREDGNVWHLQKAPHVATVVRLGELLNGDTVFLFVMPVGGATYLTNKLGASRVVPLLTAWNDPTPRASLGGLTAQAWLIANGGFGVTGVPLDPDGIPAGNPVPPLTLSGVPPAVLAQRVA